MKNNGFATIKELRELLDKGVLSHDELLQSCIDRFKKYDVLVDSALEIFDKASVLESYKQGSKLSGIPGILKDNIAVQGRISSCGSKILENFKATYDATASKRLKDAGALLMGRANMDEFAMGSSTESSAYKKTKNPWNLNRVPGGSSGGSAAAVAAGLVPWALGSDTGGSVRQPAAFCGIVGLKPTYGLVSRYGLTAYGSSLDQIGIFTRTAYDAAMVLSEIAGHDTHDSSTLPAEKKDYTRALDGTMPQNLTIGIVDNALNADGMDPEIQAAVSTAIKQFESLGAKIKHIKLPTLDYAAAAYFILSRAEAASNLSRFDGVRYGLRAAGAQSLSETYFETRHDGFGNEVKSRIMIGNYVLSAGHADQFYKKAQTVKQQIRAEFLETFKEVSMVIMPTHPIPAFTFGAFDVNKLQMDLQDYFTCPLNLAGIPGISLPCGFTKDQMPIGFQLIGSHQSEELLLQAACAYQQVTPWHTMHPQGFE
jgi:aspartyl-tRNA(Asn)/glutamyl-tRNA(Gln) amidotransferase subunit A